MFFRIKSSTAHYQQQQQQQGQQQMLNPHQPSKSVHGIPHYPLVSAKSSLGDNPTNVVIPKAIEQSVHRDGFIILHCPQGQTFQPMPNLLH